MLAKFSFESARSRFRIALCVAIVADIVQIVGFPLLVEGAGSPADDILDAAAAVALTGLLGWHWEFTPSLIGKLVPGIDMVPLWTLAVISVYRKWKKEAPAHEAPTGDIIDVIPVGKEEVKR